MNLAVLATVFGVIFVAELPDKTALASLVLGTRYRAPWVFAGIAVAFAVHVVLAVSAGSLLFLLPRRVMQAVVAVLFAIGAALMLRRHDEDEAAEAPAEPDDQADQAGPAAPSGPGIGGSSGAGHDEAETGPGGGLATLTRKATQVQPSFWAVVVRSFTVVLIAEFGDLTQLATANLAARYHAPLTVGVGAVLGLWAVGALAITGGRQLLRIVPFAWITRVAAVVMAALAIASLIAAITG